MLAALNIANHAYSRKLHALVSVTSSAKDANFMWRRSTVATRCAVVAATNFVSSAKPRTPLALATPLGMDSTMSKLFAPTVITRSTMGKHKKFDLCT